MKPPSVPRCLLVMLLMLALPVRAERPYAPETLDGARNLTAEQVVELIQSEPELVIIDARRREEHDKGHIEGAISIVDTDLTEEVLARHAPVKRQPLLFYCNGIRCLRSSNAALKAIGWQYSEVYWFRGGWNEWMEKELPVTK